MNARKPLRLRAEDADDLAVIAAHLQDAITRVGDMTWLRRPRRFVVLFSRFCWERARRDDPKSYARVRCGMHFESVSHVRTRAIDQNRREGILELLTIRHEADEPPACEVVLVFAGGGMVQVKVEALEVYLHDTGDPWPASSMPAHGEDTTPRPGPGE